MVIIDTKKFGMSNRLRQARELAGLSQNQAAKIMKMHRPTISEIEAGRRNVSAEELKEFARIYDVDVIWLMGEDSPNEASDSDLIKLAAREFSKLNKTDQEIVFGLLRSLRGKE